MIDFKQLIKYKNAFTGEKHYKIQNVKSRILVIPDIHGCSKTFMELLDKIQLSEDDYLFLLGDLINRGKNSKEVIEQIIKLIEHDYKIFPIRGNHEHRLIERHLKEYSDDDLNLPSPFRNRDLTDQKNRIKPEYLGLISNLPYYFELDNFYLVHAGFNLSSPDFFNDYESMIWLSEFETQNKINNKQVIVGHKTKNLEVIKHEIEINNPVIHLDNGCVYKKNSNLGSLLCLNLNTKELIIQKNVD